MLQEVIVELKALKTVTGVEVAQVLTYLKATGLGEGSCCTLAVPVYSTSVSSFSHLRTSPQSVDENMSKKKTSTSVESLRHNDKRKNIPAEELRDFVAEDEKHPRNMRYPRDPSLDPPLVRKGKDELDTKDSCVIAQMRQDPPPSPSPPSHVTTGGHMHGRSLRGPGDGFLARKGSPESLARSLKAGLGFG
jgi:hypothetical protein